MKKHLSQLPGWIVSRHFLYLFVFLLPQIVCLAQVNTGSNGSDGAFNPTVNTVINMANHPNGIYQYTSVNIPANVTVTFIPNANNTPVYWLVQSNVIINGTVDTSGQVGNANGSAGIGGSGGWQGGNGGSLPSGGSGPGGGTWQSCAGGCASFASVGTSGTYHSPAGGIYGNNYLLPAVGGSGGGGGMNNGTQGGGGGGGGGMILVAANNAVIVNGSIRSVGGNGAGEANLCSNGGAGSGGAIRIVTASLSGTGSISVAGGTAPDYYGPVSGGDGRIRFDTLTDNFAGQIVGNITRGYQPIIIPTAGQGAQLTVTSVGGVPVSASPIGVLSTPDAVLSAQQNNPIPIVVQCSNLSLNTPITVSVRPVNGSPVSAVGYNNSGTQASSTATVSLNMPRGGGLIYATAATGH